MVVERPADGHVAVGGLGVIIPKCAARALREAELGA
jgi:hypothetical protein